MIEVNDPAHPVHQAAIMHLANIRGYLESLAAAAGIRDTDSFARKWHILMKGSIMAAHEGDVTAAARGAGDRRAPAQGLRLRIGQRRGAGGAGTATERQVS